MENCIPLSNRRLGVISPRDPCHKICLQFLLLGQLCFEFRLFRLDGFKDVQVGGRHSVLLVHELIDLLLQQFNRLPVDWFAEPLNRRVPLG